MPVSGATIVVRANDDLQAAIDRARPGDTLLLEPGATYVGSFVLPAKEGTRPIVIRSAADVGRLPGATDRIGPEDAALLPKLKSPDTQPALRTAPGASRWQLLGIEFVGNGLAGDLIALGDGSKAQADNDSVPSELVLDRVLVRGDPVRGQKRGIALNSASTTIRNSYIADIKAAGQESQAIAGWNGPGPYTDREQLSGGGGGQHPVRRRRSDHPGSRAERHHHSPESHHQERRRGVVPLDGEESARAEERSPRTHRGNQLENCWTAAQPGYAVLFTVRNSGGRAPWATIEDVTFRSNVVKHTAGGINILGFDSTAESRTASGISMRTISSTMSTIGNGGATGCSCKSATGPRK